MKQRLSVKLKESAKNAKKEPRDQHQSRHITHFQAALFETDSLEQNRLRQPSTKTQSPMNMEYSGFKMAFLNSERRTLILPQQTSCLGKGIAH